MKPTPAFRKQLALGAATGRLELLRIWLTYVAGFDSYGLKQAATGMTETHYLEILEDLSEHQFSDLMRRGLIPGPDAHRARPAPVTDEEAGPQYCTPPGVSVITLHEDGSIYRLSDGGELFLLDHELELLCAAGFPHRWSEVFAFVWRFIAPPFRRSDLVARLRDISAILNAPDANPATQIAQARELVFWPLVSDRALAHLIQAERQVLHAATAAIGRGVQDHELVSAVWTLRLSTDAARHDGALISERVDDPTS